MTGTGYISLIIILANLIVSYQGFKSTAFFERYKFQVDKIRLHKDYKTLVTAGFLHVNWMHLIFNLIALYFFSGGLEAQLGELGYIIIYTASLVGGNLFSLLLHKRDGYFSSVGASGAVCGLMFASIALFPGFSISLFIISLPGWLYGLLFIAFTIYGIRSKQRNIGYETYLGGALVGMLVAIAMHPQALLINIWPILIVAVPSIVFIYLIVTRPQVLLIDNLFFKTTNYNYTVDQRYNLEKVDKQKEVDRILDKINRSGMKSLTPKEKQALDEYSKIIQ